MADHISGQLGSGSLGAFGLGWPGPLTVQQERIDSFTVTPTGPIAAGTSVTLCWTTSFATGISISGIGPVTPTAGGCVTVTPSGTTTYTASTPGGETRSITVTVITALGAISSQEVFEVLAEQTTLLVKNPQTVFEVLQQQSVLRAKMTQIVLELKLGKKRPNSFPEYVKRKNAPGNG